MIELLIWVLILVLVFGVIWYIISLIPLPPPFAQIAQIIVAVVLLLIIVSLLLGIAPPLRGPILR
jgi:uncharacterized membrane protein (GlpM family)